LRHTVFCVRRSETEERVDDLNITTETDRLSRNHLRGTDYDLF